MAVHQVIVTHGVKQRTPRAFLAKGKVIGVQTTANAGQYTSIANEIQQLATDTTALDKAEAAAANRGKEEIKQRNVALNQFKKSLRAFLRALQGLCDAAPDPTQAEALAVGAGVSVKGSTTPRPKAEISGKALGNGEVHLYARLPATKNKRLFWEWQQMSADGKTWVTIATTNDADFLVQNLTPATLISFRCRFTRKNVPSLWTQALVVHVL